MKGIIIYKGKYGATKQYAEWLGSALHLPVFTQDSLASEDLDSYDLIIAGGSVYMGIWQMHKWLLQHSDLSKNKKLFLFIVCGTAPDDKNALDQIARQNIPPDMLATCPVYFLHGRMLKKHLSWFDSLMLKMSAVLTKELKKILLK